MQLICVSRGTLAGGTELASQLADNLGYPCLTREELTEAAINEGIQVGRLETAMLKPGQFSERLSLEREHYLAFSRAFLCERALEGDLVYQGRTGHLLLPAIRHVLRVRVVADREYRIRAAEQQLGVGRDRAQQYIDEVDEDRRRWARAMYGVLWEEVAHYDLVLNLERLSAANAAAAVTSTAGLPEFQMTPASKKALEDFGIAARARVLLARDDRTGNAHFTTTCTDGIVTVTYRPEDSRLAEHIPEIVGVLPGSREVRATMASTSLVWVQETFDPETEAFSDVVEVASKWHAAVSLIRLAAEEEGVPAETETVSASAVESAAPASAEHNGGIEDDVEEPSPKDDKGLRQTVDALARLGRTGGGRVVRNVSEHLLEALHQSSPCTMVVVGDVFLSKSHAARTRMTRELRSLLADHIRAPVVLAEDLRDRYLFGKQDALRLGGFAVLAVALYVLVLGNQSAVLKFLHAEDWVGRLIAAVAVFLFVPLIAHAWGTVAHTLLKLIRME